MADIELVVKIDEEQYEFIKQSMTIDKVKDYHALLYDICERIKNGTPLPKGHGRLGDLSKIYVELNEAQVEGTEEYKGLGEAKQIVCNAPTIIKEDESEDK